MSEEEKLKFRVKELKHFNDILENQNLDKAKEIERLNKRIEDLKIINEEHQILNRMIRKELQQKENIIKEVREYIEEKEKDDDNWIDYELCIEPIVIKKILEKENKE